MARLGDAARSRTRPCVERMLCASKDNFTSKGQHTFYLKKSEICKNEKACMHKQGASSDRTRCTELAVLSVSEMRIVMATRDLAELPLRSLIGLPVVHHSGTAAFGNGKIQGGKDGPRLHDAHSPTCRADKLQTFVRRFSGPAQCPGPYLPKAPPSR